MEGEGEMEGSRMTLLDSGLNVGWIEVPLPRWGRIKFRDGAMEILVVDMLA